ncbi:MAG: helix-hairpin-helix domain-containing protein [Elusimicrobiota bacterium]
MGLSIEYKLQRIRDKKSKRARMMVYKKVYRYPKWLIRKARMMVKRQRVFSFLFCFLFLHYTLHITLYTASLNLNTATYDELKEIPTLGAKRTRAILGYRERTPFRDIYELEDVCPGVSVDYLQGFVSLYAVSKTEWETKRTKNLNALQRAKLCIWGIESDGIILYVEFPDGGNAIVLGGIKNVPAVLRKDPNKFLRQHIIADDYIRRTAGFFGWKPRVDKLFILKFDDTVLEILPIILKDIVIWELYVPIDEALLKDASPPPSVSRIFSALPQKRPPEVFSVFDKIRIYQPSSRVTISAVKDGDVFRGLEIVFNEVKFLVDLNTTTLRHYDTMTLRPNDSTDTLTITDGVLIFKTRR